MTVCSHQATLKEHPDHLHTLKHHGVQSVSLRSRPAAWLLASSPSRPTSARGHHDTDSHHQQRSDNSLISTALHQHHYPTALLSLSLFVSLYEGSSELLLEGDILLPRNRNALVCATKNCFWKKSSNGLVEVPFTLSRVFCK